MIVCDPAVTITKSLLGYCLIGSNNMSTKGSERNKQVFVQDVPVLIKSIHYG